MEKVSLRGEFRLEVGLEVGLESIGTINALFSEISKQDLIPTDHFLKQNWRLGRRLQAGGNNSAMAAEEEVDRPNHKKRKS